MNRMYVGLIPVLAMAACDFGPAVGPVDGPLFFEATAYDVEDDAPIMSFSGESFGHGWEFYPDADRPFLEPPPEGVSTRLLIHTGPGQLAEGVPFADVMVVTYGVPTPPGPTSFPAGVVDDPTDQAGYGTMSGRFAVSDDVFSPRRFYDVVDGTVVLDRVQTDGPAEGTLFLVGQAREDYEGWPATLRLEGTFRTHKVHEAVCTLIDPDCKDN